MSTRERWIVYPLLFLTLGIALTDKITRLVRTDTVVCKTLLVTDREGKLQQVYISSGVEGGIIQAHANPPGVNVVLGYANQLVGLMFTDSDNRVLGVGSVVPVRQHRAPMQTPQAEDGTNPTPAEKQPVEGQPEAAESQSPPAEPEPSQPAPDRPN